ncbi:MAG: hypothetical protein ACKO44_05185 [Algoriphagus sp.]
MSDFDLGNVLIYFSAILIFLGLSFYLYFALYSKLFFSKNKELTPEKASSFGEFINGLTGPIFALSGFLIIYGTIINQNQVENIQQFESTFFKTLDYHRENIKDIQIFSPRSCKQIEGVSVWVTFYSQIKRAYNVVESDSALFKLKESDKLDLAFLTFFYGLGSTDTTRIYKKITDLKITNDSANDYVFKLKSVKHCEDFSNYFVGYSSLFNSVVIEYFSYIQYIDELEYLETEQKKKYIDLLVVQNNSFSNIVLHYYLNSTIVDNAHLILSKKYNVVSNIDSHLFL